MIFVRVLILSFCSMSYQLLTARALAELTHQHILAYSLSFGFFLLGMGLGGIYYGKSLNHKSPLKTFFYTENILAILGGLATFLIFCLFIFMNVYVFSDRHLYLTKVVLPYAFLLPAQIFIFSIGFFSGFELPVWLKLNQKKIKPTLLSGTGSLLGASYLGGFFGSVLITIFIVPAFGLITGCILIGFINIAVLAESLFSYRAFNIKRGIFLFIPLIILYTGGRWDAQLTQLHLKTWYLKTEITSIKKIKELPRLMSNYGEVLRIRTTYQNIDIIPSNFLKGQLIPQMALYGKGMAFYLNRQPQFFSNFWKTYHESMVVGGAHLANKEPEDILILGGGDGLLVSQIIRLYKKVKRVTLVEIDPTIIKTANNYIPLRRLNQNALKNKKIKIITDDAFTYVAKDKKNYDAIFIDFPFPISFDLSRLYSLEFYIRVKSLLKQNGFIVLDTPIWKYIDNEALNVKPMPQDILYSTLSHAGYQNIIAFGKKEPFLFLQKTGKKTNFKDQKIKYPISQQTLENLIIIDNIVKDVEIKNEYINSVFKPVRFKY